MDVEDNNDESANWIVPRKGDSSGWRIHAAESQATHVVHDIDEDCKRCRPPADLSEDFPYVATPRSGSLLAF